MRLLPPAASTRPVLRQNHIISSVSSLRTIYRITRGILFTAIVLVAVVYLALYVLLTVPSVQSAIKGRVEREVSHFLGGEVYIGSLVIKPFNEVVIKNLDVRSPEGERVLAVETLGAGISLWRLVSERRIELSYGEIIGMEARIAQNEEGGPLNIAFIIDAFAPKDKNKPPAKFDLNLRNVVIRRSSVSFDKEWLPRIEGERRTDFNHLRMWDLKADLNLPKIANDDFTVDLRRLSFNLSGGLDVEKIAFRTHITPRSISVRDLIIKLPSTELRPSDIKLSFNGYADIPTALSQGTHRVIMLDNEITPADFGWLYPPLREWDDKLILTLDAYGNRNEATLKNLAVELEEGGLSLMIKGTVSDTADREEFGVALDDFKLKIGQDILEGILRQIPGNTAGLLTLAAGVGDLDLSCTGTAHPGKGMAEIDARVVGSNCGGLYLSASGNNLRKGSARMKGEITTDHLSAGKLFGHDALGSIDSDMVFDLSVKGKDVEGDADVNIGHIIYNGMGYEGIALSASRHGKEFSVKGEVDNAFLLTHLSGEGSIDGDDSWLQVRADIARVNTSMFGVLPKYPDYTLSARIDADLEGGDIDTFTGDIRLNDLSFTSPGKKGIVLDHMILKARDKDARSLSIDSDWISGYVKGDFKIRELPKEILSIVARIVPSLVPPPASGEAMESDASFSFTVEADNTLPEFFNLPFRLLVPVPVKGVIDGTNNTASVNVDVPYIQQGKNKLVRDTSLELLLDGEASTVDLNATTTFPVKKGDLKLDLQIFGQEDNIFADVGWNVPGNDAFQGNLYLGAELSRNELSSKPEVSLEINPSVFDFGSARWNIDRSRINYRDNTVDVSGLRIWHDGQFVEIDGKASAIPEDSITVRLAEIDVDYIFDTLNINYVSFGGTATGDVYASGALSKEPVAYTDNLRVDKLSYNGAVLGDAALKSHWDNDLKEVTIYADIMGDRGNRTTVDGGIWVTRDSLSFDINADKVPVTFLAPFMSAFTTDVKGRASGDVKLYGTFSDIDLRGRVFADSLAMRLDYTNVYYHGSDSVIMEPGRILIPSFRLYDRNGRSAILNGELTHRYFHDPQFTFRVTDMRDMLCYDTNSQMNPDWYGTMYGNGSAIVRGWPGVVSVSVDMTAVGESMFTFVLNDTQAAEDYRFLTFSDRRREEAERARADSVPDILSAFRKKIDMQNSSPTNFQMDIRASVTPSTLMTLVMDPVAGDKITARGNGNIQIDYGSESDQMQMFGKYILEEGNYNFSLQDLILKDFTIRQGSSISFNGDPLNANLDIAAAYRVNTNLSDLDKSFSTDRDLNRTNVPVDAVLMVTGAMQHPDISFDIELPTLTQDVERKVKSIISTDDMMSRQIIYLLALNRFYTPEYMGATSNGGELAAVASSTLSSQLSSVLGSLTDKLSVSPSFRSDKGDFSDIEVDVALSSRLLNNRLLINGNFGYRDRSTSSTTFVGDFDIEYLLNRSGNLRLKAYNHFNDQNYYLRQALTTQGLGVIYRREFDNPFTFLRKRKREPAIPPAANRTDSVANPADTVR